jgi:hypothetical protein
LQRQLCKVLQRHGLPHFETNFYLIYFKKHFRLQNAYNACNVEANSKVVGLTPEGSFLKLA